MQVAVRSTLTLMVAYLIVVIISGIWVTSFLRGSANQVSEQTARFVGIQIRAALFDSLADTLLRGDDDALETLRGSVGMAVERSTALTSLLVINEQGRVVASNDRTRRGTQFETPAELFPAERLIRVTVADTAGLAAGVHIVDVPMVRQSKLLGYVRVGVRQQALADLYDGLYSGLLLSALVGLLLFIGLGVLLQFQLRRLGKGLAEIITSAAGLPQAPHNRDGDEFQDVRDVAQQVGEELENARDESKRAWQELDHLARVLKVGVVLFDSDSQPQFVSDAAREILAGTDLHTADERLEVVLEQASEAVQAVREGRATSRSLELEQPAAGGASQLRVELYPLDQREWHGFLMLMRDTFLVDALDQDLRAASRFRGLSALLSGAAHDLRAPLNAMNINLEVVREVLGSALRGEGVVTDQVQQALTHTQVTAGEIGRLNRQIDVLLEQSAPGTDDRQLVAVTRLVDELSTLLAPQARSQKVRLTVDTATSGKAALTVMGNALQLKQALLNVLINALESLQDGGEVDVSVARADEDIEIRVRDSGPGIPGGVLGQIFDMHFTTRSAGTGIGLYVTRAIIRSHGGDVEVDSALGEGAVFVIRLPAARDDGDANACEPIAPAGSLSDHV